jgi:phosphoribosylformylglycinamidine cyclo-ligase
MARIRTGTWEMPAIFKVLQQGGNIADTELYRTFNCGIGMVLAVPTIEAAEVLLRLKALGETAMIIGDIARCEPGKESAELVS